MTNQSTKRRNTENLQTTLCPPSAAPLWGARQTTKVQRNRRFLKKIRGNFLQLRDDESNADATRVNEINLKFFAAGNYADALRNHHPNG
jgi:hypothetical protein